MNKQLIVDAIAGLLITILGIATVICAFTGWTNGIIGFGLLTTIQFLAIKYGFWG